MLQAWCEDASGDMPPSTPSDDNQLDDWLATTETSQLTGQQTTPFADSGVLFQDSKYTSGAEQDVNGIQHAPESPAHHLVSPSQASEAGESAAETSAELGQGFFRPGSEVTATTATETELEGAGDPGVLVLQGTASYQDTLKDDAAVQMPLVDVLSPLY